MNNLQDVVDQQKNVSHRWWNRIKFIITSNYGLCAHITWYIYKTCFPNLLCVTLVVTYICLIFFFFLLCQFKKKNIYIYYIKNSRQQVNDQNK